MAAAGMWALEEQQGLWSDPSSDAFLAGLRRDHAHASMLAEGINAIEGLVVAHEVHICQTGHIDDTALFTLPLTLTLTLTLP